MSLVAGADMSAKQQNRHVQHGNAHKTQQETFLLTGPNVPRNSALVGSLSV